MANSAGAAIDQADKSKSEAGPVATIYYTQNDGDQRITLDLVDAVGHVSTRDGDELIIWFDQPRLFDLGSLSYPPGSLVKGIRTPGVGPSRWLVLDLAPESQVQSEMLGDHELLITIAGDQEAVAPPLPVTPEVAKVGKAVGKANDDPVAPTQEVAATEEPASPVSPVSQEQVKPKKKPMTRSGPRPLVSMAKPVQAPLVQPEPAKTPVVRAATSTPAKPNEVPKATDGADDAAPAQTTSAPGQFEVDELALDRALERTLTREGALLMPFGMVELEPSISYVRQELDTPALINVFGFPGFGEANITRNDFIASLALRVGLPLDAQLEVEAPFTYVNQSEMMAIGFNPVTVDEDDTGAFGDLRVGLAKTVLKEKSWWPDVVARIRWDSQTGRAVDNDIALGGGAHELTGSVSLVKSQDPLAFFGSVSYEATFEENDLDPGDRIGLSVGTVLAASPETSLRASLRQSYTGDAEFDGDKLDGTDQLAATFNVGASSILGRGILLDASAEVGLTEDAPDYAARVSLPIRFDLRRAFSLGR